MLREFKKAIYLRVSDGLGNQMFQYAAGRALALRNQVELFLEPEADFFKWRGSNRRFGLEHFQLSHHVSIVYPKTSFDLFRKNKLTGDEIPLYQEANAYQYQKEMAELKAPFRVRGFFQSFDYFSDLPRSSLLEEFSLKKKPSQKARQLKAEIEKQANPVCVHIRLADYKASSLFHCLSDSYYRAAFQEIKRNIPGQNPPVWVFSNGTREEVKELCRKSGIETAQYHLDHSIPEWELIHVMASCRHHVCANSTFSWWAAWLKGKVGITTLPKQWFRNPSWEPKGLRVSGWVTI